MSANSVSRNFVQTLNPQLSTSPPLHRWHIDNIHLCSTPLPPMMPTNICSTKPCNCSSQIMQVRRVWHWQTQQETESNHKRDHGQHQWWFTSDGEGKKCTKGEGKGKVCQVCCPTCHVTLSKNDWSGLGHMVVTPVHNMTKSSKFYKILTSSWLHQVVSSRVVSSPDAKYRQDTVIW